MEEPLFRRLGLVGSTQDEAAQLPLGSVVVADAQSQGRGRHGRSWEAPPGAGLLASFVCPPNPLASLAAGVAAAEACGRGVTLKWPNDLLLQDRKLGGILVEGRPGRAIVGVGINLLWSPPHAARLEADREELLLALRRLLPDWMRARPEDVISAWRRHSATLGRTVRVELAGEVYEGVAEAIRPDGALIVASRAFVAGDVIHLRPAEPLRPVLGGPRPTGPV